MRLGRQGQAPYATFAEAVLRAEAEAEIVLVDRVAAAEDWRAAAHLLKTRFRKRWGENETDAQPAPTEVNITVTGTRSASSAGSDPNE
jgi:hypothetical protein